RIVAPSAAGFIALIVCAPMAIAQRSAATGAGALWVPELSAAQVGVMCRLFFLTTVRILALILFLMDGLRDRSDRPSLSARIRSDAVSGGRGGRTGPRSSERGERICQSCLSHCT